MTGLEDDCGMESLTCFIRDELGCSCPPEVFEHIETEAEPVSFAEIGGRWLIRVGGRLMVLLCRPASIDQLQSRFPAAMKRGAELRDREGFNRFRLVVETADVEAVAMRLDGALQAIAPADDRLHLHVVATTQVPHALR